MSEHDLVGKAVVQISEVRQALRELDAELESVYEKIEELEEEYDDEEIEDDRERELESELDDLNDEAIEIKEQIQSLSAFTEGGEEFFSEVALEQYVNDTISEEDVPDWIVIDWDATRDGMYSDYTHISVCGYDYYYRS